MNRLSTLITLLLVAVATFLSVTCSHAFDAPAKAGAAQRLKTIIEDNYQPYSFLNGKGQADGFAVDIAKAVAREMDLELEMRAGKWDLAIQELESGSIDVIPLMAYSPEWARRFNFSVPYVVVYDSIFFKKGTKGIRSLDDLSGKTVILTNNDLAHNYLLSSGLSKTMNIVLVNSGPEALKQLAAGKGDAAVMPKLIGLVTAKKMNIVGIETSPLLIDSYTRSWGFAVRAGNQALLERLNQGLNIIKSSGEYDVIYKKWFRALEDTHFNLKRLLPYGSGALLLFLGIITWNVMLKRQVKAKTENLTAEIEKRKQTEELLRESSAALQEKQNLLSQAEELGKVGGWEFDTETGHLTWTKTVYDIHELDFNSPPTLVQGVNYYTPASRPIIEQAVRRSIDLGEPFDLELEIITDKGNLRNVHTIGKPDLARRKVSGFFQDITERRQAEETQRQSRRAALNMMTDAIQARERAEQMSQEVRRLNTELEQRVLERTAQLEAANKELEAFSYSVSHDLRAPLRHVDGYVELLVSRFRENLPEKALHYLDTIAASARQMGVLIDDLLQFSRTGRAEMRLEGTDMNQTVKEALTTLRENTAGRSIEWVIGELPSVRGDHALLRQVWVNLLDNAVKYSRTRDIARIKVSADRQKEEIVFSVADNGVGFDVQYIHKLFGVFQRLHSAEEFEGTGIGLATVQRIINRHGGRVWAEAVPDLGATFYFTLPVLKENDHV